MNDVSNVNPTVKKEQEFSTTPNSVRKSAISNLRESIKNLNNKELASSTKHKIILLGDSHLRGYACSLKSIISKEYDILGVVKPGSGSSELKESVKEGMAQYSFNDLIIISSGTNDLEQNGFKDTFQNIRSFITNNYHSNILLMNIPYRYDLPNSHEVNKEISAINSKLKKLVRALPHARYICSDNDRKLFTNHGLHRNKLGKMLISLQLAEYIITTFGHKSTTPISLRWYNDEEGNSLHHDLSQTTQNRNSNRHRKTPITRSNDFLWIT